MAELTGRRPPLVVWRGGRQNGTLANAFMPAILLPLSFVAAFLVVRGSNLPSDLRSYRASLLLASVIWALVLTAITEILSLFSWLSFRVACFTWSAILVLLIWRLAGNRTHIDLPTPSGFDSFSTTERGFCIWVIALVVVIGLIGCIAPPNTYDSMTYHMSRVMHWAQDHSVRHYPTSILRQLHHAPWAEFAILHLQLLSGTDRLANTVQWCAMVGSLIAVSLLTQRLGATARGQLFAVVACATLPMGILQASSTQNDYVVSYWLACFVFFEGLLNRRANLLCALGAGGALGLAILTKGTAYVYVAFSVAHMMVGGARRSRCRQLRIIVLVIGIAVAANVGHYVRNYNLYGSPFGPQQEGSGYGYTNDTLSLAAVASNVIRNVGLHVGTPLGQVNLQLDRVVEMLHGLIGISSADPRTTWRGTSFHALASLHEDATGNLLHLFCIAAGMLFCVSAYGKERDALVHIGMIVAGAVLFCIVFKWQPWHSRLHLPLFVLSTPIVGLFLGRYRNHSVADLAVTCLLIAALPWLLANASRPVVGPRSIFTTPRIQQYFSNRPLLARDYIDTARVLSQLSCGDIGLRVGSDDWEYPLWVALKHEMSTSIYVEHVNVTNVSRAAGQPPFRTKSVCAIVVAGSDGPDRTYVGETMYTRVWSGSVLTVYARASPTL